MCAFVHCRTNNSVASKAIGVFSTRSEFFLYRLIHSRDNTSSFQQNPQERYHPNLHLICLDDISWTLMNTQYLVVLLSIFNFCSFVVRTLDVGFRLCYVRHRVMATFLSLICQFLPNRAVEHAFDSRSELALPRSYLALPEHRQLIRATAHKLARTGRPEPPESSSCQL
jgi:hypothetical protein